MSAIQQLLASYGAPVATANTFFHQVRTGTGASASITPGFNSTDLGALFISKRTNAAQNHFITDSVTGTGTSLQLPSTLSASAAAHITAFGSSSITLGTGSSTNASGVPYLDLVFQRTPGFLDIVTGNGVGSLISHNLGITPGFIMGKNVSANQLWGAWHRGTGAWPTPKTGLSPNSSLGALATAGAAVTSTNFEPEIYGNSSGSLTNIDSSATRYYVFAHNPSGNIICDMYTGNGSAAGPVINLGWQPKFVMVKGVGATSWWFATEAGGWNNWYRFDNKCCIVTQTYITVSSTGFQLATTSADVNGSGSGYLFVAIR